MPPREWKLRVQDILEAVAGARQYVEGMRTVQDNLPGIVEPLNRLFLSEGD